MNKKFNAYLLNEKYYHYLFSDNNLTQMISKETRPYIGFIGIKINGMDYAIPLWSDPNNKIIKSKKYSFLIKKNGEKLGVLRINKMIPVINNSDFINMIDINNINYNDGIRLLKELQYLNQPEVYDKVYKLANEIYKRRYNATEYQIANDNDLKFAVDFKQAEKLMLSYEVNIIKRKMDSFYINEPQIEKEGKLFYDINELFVDQSIPTRNEEEPFLTKYGYEEFNDFVNAKLNTNKIINDEVVSESYFNIFNFWLLENYFYKKYNNDIAKEEFIKSYIDVKNQLSNNKKYINFKIFDLNFKYDKKSFKEEIEFISLEEWYSKNFMKNVFYQEYVKNNIFKFNFPNLEKVPDEFNTRNKLLFCLGNPEPVDENININSINELEKEIYDFLDHELNTTNNLKEFLDLWNDRVSEVIKSSNDLISVDFNNNVKKMEKAYEKMLEMLIINDIDNHNFKISDLFLEYCDNLLSSKDLSNSEIYEPFFYLGTIVLGFDNALNFDDMSIVEFNNYKQKWSTVIDNIDELKKIRDICEKVKKECNNDWDKLNKWYSSNLSSALTINNKNVLLEKNIRNNIPKLSIDEILNNFGNNFDLIEIENNNGLNFVDKHNFTEILDISKIQNLYNYLIEDDILVKNCVNMLNEIKYDKFHCADHIVIDELDIDYTYELESPKEMLEYFLSDEFLCEVIYQELFYNLKEYIDKEKFIQLYNDEIIYLDDESKNYDLYINDFLNDVNNNSQIK